MKIQMNLGARGAFLTVALIGLLGPILTHATEAGKNAIKQDHVVAGGPKDFMEVRHVVLKGSNEDIGRAIAVLAMERYGLKLDASSDRLRTRALRRYAEKNYPILHERMRGVASAFGKQPNDDAWDFSALPYLLGVPGGCSVVHYPPRLTMDGKSIVSRNYEFGTGTMLDTRPARGELPATARPYLLELHPDKGYASLALCAYDLLSGVLDGINSEGLTVAMLADSELLEKPGTEPAYEGGVGLGVQQVLRLLLDTCANVEEAKEALLVTKQYYEFLPVHYLVADRHGKAFVWEYSQAHNKEYIIENPDQPLITTNFSLHRHLQGKKPPTARAAKDVCARYCELAERLEAQSGKLTLEQIKQYHNGVDVKLPAAVFGLRPPIRTLWHVLYCPEQRTMQASFYLGDKPDPKEPGKALITRSDYVEFALAGN